MGQISRLRIPIIAAFIILFLSAGLWSSRKGHDLHSIITGTDSSLPKFPSGHVKEQKPPSRMNLTTTPHDRPLVLFAYYETEEARVNLDFFVAHGLNAAADFIFILNGDTKDEKRIPKRDNIRIVKRENKCYDLGAFAEVLTQNDLYRGYKRFILMNASIRGPFVPTWSNACWMDMYLDKLSDSVKLVGMTINCEALMHVQSMIWALDFAGLETLLHPTPETVEKFEAITKNVKPLPDPNHHLPHPRYPGIDWCPEGYWEAVSIEVFSTSLIIAAGYQIEVMETAFHGERDWEKTCWDNGQVLYSDHYFGIALHPYELVFMKTNRNIDPNTLAQYTKWADGREYSSYDYC